jgi:sporulation protein YlmC with PRC-barrel domain
MTRITKFTVSAAAIAMFAGAVAQARQDTPRPAQPQQPAPPDTTYKPSKDGQTTQPERTTREVRAASALVPADWLIGADVRGTGDEDLGEVNDLIVLRTKGKVAYALVGHGGVLKVGEKTTVVPFSAFNWNADKKQLHLPVTKDNFKAAPTFEGEDYDSLATPARTEAINSHFNITHRDGMDRDGIDRNPSRTDDPNRTNDPNRNNPDRDGMNRQPSDRTMLTASEHPVLRISKIKGEALMSNDGRDLGKVDDVIVDTSTGKIALVCVTFGGVMGIGSDKVCMPWPAFDVNKEGRLYTVNVDKEQLRSAPKIESRDWAELRQTGFVSNVYGHFGMQDRWSDAGQNRVYGTNDGRNPDRMNSGKYAEYDRAYINGHAKEISGRVVSVSDELAMSSGPTCAVVTVDTGSGATTKVHLAPMSYLAEKNLMIRTGDRVTIKGREATIDGKNVLIASEVTRESGQPITFRNSDGSTNWSWPR